MSKLIPLTCLCLLLAVKTLTAGNGIVSALKPSTKKAVDRLCMEGQTAEVTRLPDSIQKLAFE